MSLGDPITKVYLVYFKAENKKQETEFEESLAKNTHIKSWIKHMMLFSKNYYEK